MAAIIRAQNLTKSYDMGGQVSYALNDVSLEIQQGQMLAVLGGSSTGKSTLLHTLACMQRADWGWLEYEGQEVNTLTDEGLTKLRTGRVGFIFQAFNLLPNETLLANVEVPLKAQGVGAWDRKEMAEAALRSVGLGNALDYRPNQLSTRQRQCVSIARAQVHDPSVIFADDPTRGQDSTSREEIIGLLQKINRDGKTVVIATTDSGVARHCQRIIKIDNGMIVDDLAVDKQRMITANRIPGGALRDYEREVVVCSRCGYGNYQDMSECRRCTFPLQLTQEEEKAIEGRLSGTNAQALSVESPSDEGEVPAEDLINELKAIPLFSGLGAKTLVKIVPLLESRQYEKGSTIIKQGDPGDSFYILRDGNVRVILEKSGAAFATVAELGPGEGFGEMALLTSLPRSATVVATAGVEAWSIPKDSFDKLVAENLTLAVYFNRTLSQRLSSLQEKLIH